MDRKAQLVATANENLDIFKKGCYVNQKGKVVDIADQLKASIDGAQLYSPQMLEELMKNHMSSHYNTVIEVTGETTFEAAERLSKEGHKWIASLNFASARTPGGGFLKGSVAQEESLSRASGLYPTIVQNKVKEMYDKGRASQSALYTDYMIYSPDVPVFRDERGNFLDEVFTTSIITAAAPNAGVVRQGEPQNVKKIDSTMEQRIRYILRLAHAKCNNVLVLGAFGCGVFKNNPHVVAYTFNRLLRGEFSNQFEKVVFAVYDKTPTKEVYKPFAGALGTKR